LIFESGTTTNISQDKKSERKAKRLQREQKHAHKHGSANGSANGDSVGHEETGATGNDAQSTGTTQRRALHAQVEEADDDE
jgi:hypothetical protein